MYKIIDIQANMYNPRSAAYEYERELNSFEESGYICVSAGITQNTHNSSKSYWAIMHKPKEYVPVGMARFDVPTDVVS